MASVEDEKIKLVANALDRASTACLALGVIAPLAAAFYSVESNLPTWSLTLVVGTLIWLAAAVVLHIGARRALDGLSQ